MRHLDLCMVHISDTLIKSYQRNRRCDEVKGRSVRP
jgi:hypothetical protein